MKSNFILFLFKEEGGGREGGEGGEEGGGREGEEGGRRGERGERSLNYLLK